MYVCIKTSNIVHLKKALTAYKEQNQLEPTQYSVGADGLWHLRVYIRLNTKKHLQTNHFLKALGVN